MHHFTRMESEAHSFDVNLPPSDTSWVAELLYRGLLSLVECLYQGTKGKFPPCGFTSPHMGPHLPCSDSVLSAGAGWEIKSGMSEWTWCIQFVDCDSHMACDNKKNRRVCPVLEKPKVQMWYLSMGVGQMHPWIMMGLSYCFKDTPCAVSLSLQEMPHWELEIFLLSPSRCPPAVLRCTKHSHASVPPPGDTGSLLSLG